MDKLVTRLIVIATVVVIGSWAAQRAARFAQDVRITAQSGWDHVDRRGNPPGWIEFDHPSDWYVTNESNTGIQSFDPTNDYPPTTDGDWVSIHDQEEYADNFSGNWPKGTVTETVSIGGISATKYTLPTDTAGGVYSGYSVVSFDVPSATNNSRSMPYYIVQGVTGADNQTELDQRTSVLDTIVSRIDFIDDHIRGQTWDRSLDSAPLMAGVRQFKAYHPRGWKVTDSITGFSIAAPGTFVGGGVGLVFYPGQSSTLWDAAEEMLGDSKMRHVPGSTQVLSGIRNTEYVRNFDPPVRIVVSVPDTSYGTQTYWLNEQTTWEIMYNTSVWYDEVTAYPGP